MIELSKGLISDLVRYNSGVINYPVGKKTINEKLLKEIVEAINNNDYTMTGTFMHSAKKLKKVIALNDKKLLKEYITQLAYNWNPL